MLQTTLTRGALFALAVAAVVAPACGGDDSRLAREDTTSSSTGGDGASGGEGGMATTSTGGMGGVGGIVEPPTPTTLTVVNGTVDSPAVRFCFDASPPVPGNLPYPGVQGLPFARGAAITRLEGTIPAGDVEVTVIGGNLTATGGVTCDALRTAPPMGVEVATVGVIPGSAFEEERSLLLVTAGCLGGEGHSHELEEQVCGPGYSEATPNPALFAGFMSRLGELDRIRMQFVQASLATQDAAVRIRPGDGAATATQAVPIWNPGAIAPYPPFDNFNAALLLNIPLAQILLLPTNSSTPFSETSFSQAFANSTLAVNELTNGDAVSFVGVGAAPEIASGPWWSAFTFTVVESLP